MNEKKLVLLIEDDADTRLLYTQALKMKGYQVEHASTGEQGLAYLRSAHQPNVILLDLSIPGTDSRDLMKTIRDNPDWKDIKVIVVSGWEDLKTRASEIGADGFMQKPVDLRKFQETVQSFASL